MANEISFDIAHTAIIAMNCQAGIVSIYAKPPEEFLERAGSVLRAARKVGMQVVHVQIVCGLRYCVLSQLLPPRAPISGVEPKFGGGGGS